MQTRLLIIRHGASHHKEAGVIGGPRGCRGLTDEGRRQVAALAARLVRELLRRPAAIYASVIPRAIETAQILAATLGHDEVVRDCGRCTWHSPTFADGMAIADDHREHGIAGGGGFRPFQAENGSWGELVERTGRAFERIASRHKGETVVIATHAEPVMGALIAFGNLPLATGFDLVIAPTGLTEWYTDGDPDSWPRPRWVLARLNDSAHLAGLAD